MSSSAPDVASGGGGGEGGHVIRKRRSDNAKHVRVVVVGMPGVGKSAITVRFLTKRFIGEYDEFLESKHSTTMPVDMEMVTFDIVDTAAEPDCTVKEEHLRWADGLLFVFDLTQLPSFQALPKMYRQTQDARKSDSSVSSVPLVIVGNKLDMAHCRTVPQNDVERLASRWGCPYLELSAADEDLGRDVQDAFIALYREIRQQRAKSARTSIFDRIFKR